MRARARTRREEHAPAMWSAVRPFGVDLFASAPNSRSDVSMSRHRRYFMRRCGCDFLIRKSESYTQWRHEIPRGSVNDASAPALK